jgi:hypothetical protein
LKRFYGRLYFYPSKNDSLAIEVITQADMMKRRLREGVEFIHDGGGGALLAHGKLQSVEMTGNG